MYVELSRTAESLYVLPAVLAACFTDYYDGQLARRSGNEGMAGRLLDNCCDAIFLGLVLAAFAQREIWSDPVWGSAVRYWEHANWLPLVMLFASFSLYLLRWAVCSMRDLPLLPSLRGHSAGVFNYVLVVIGAIQVLPGVDLTRWILEPSSVTVALLNATAVTDNVRLMLFNR